MCYASLLSALLKKNNILEKRKINDLEIPGEFPFSIFENASISHNPMKMCDQSPYTIEERLIAAVWMHDRVRDKKKIPEVQRMFQARFNKQAPTARILREWEKKVFETGSVLDAPRCGRPATRMMHIAAVRESILRSPQKSFRKRSAELQIPHTTLQKVMKIDLQLQQHQLKQLQQLPKMEYPFPQLQVVQEVTVTDQESNEKNVETKESLQFHNILNHDISLYSLPVSVGT